MQTQGARAGGGAVGSSRGLRGSSCLPSASGAAFPFPPPTQPGRLQASPGCDRRCSAVPRDQVRAPGLWASGSAREAGGRAGGLRPAGLAAVSILIGLQSHQPRPGTASCHTETRRQAQRWRLSPVALPRGPRPGPAPHLPSSGLQPLSGYSSPRGFTRVGWGALGVSFTFYFVISIRAWWKKAPFVSCQRLTFHT